MKKQSSRVTQCWLGVVAGLGMSGAIVLPSTTFAQTAPSNIVPDATLGAESSLVVPNYNGFPVEAIAGGAQRGQNLFHSFSQFNVSGGRGAYFAIQNDVVRNVLTRVTGGSRSEILGTLGTFRPIDGSVRVPGVNLFLMNPNGIVFGENASLDIGGSFFATTANAVQLGDAGLFSASQPALSNLLTVSPSAYLFNAIASQNLPEIVVRSQATNTVFGNTSTGLQVPNGQSLLLLGGNVNLEGGQLNAPGGRVELGGLRGVGSVDLAINDQNLQLGFPTGVAFADVSLTNASKVSTLGSSGKGIAINAQDVNILSGSSVTTGIALNLGDVGSKAGDININATGVVTVADASVIGSAVLSTGNGGNINIIGKTVNVINGSQASSVSLGQGDAGNVTIQAKDTISFSGRNASGSGGGILTSVTLGAGNGGDIKLEARSISLSDGANLFTNSLVATGRSGNISIIARDSFSTQNGSLVSTSTQGQGDAGSILIQAGNRVSFEGVSANGVRGGVSSKVTQVQNFNFTDPRSGGDIRVETGTLNIVNGAAIDSSTSGQGNAGKVVVQARGSILLENSSFILSNVEAGGVGNAGSIDITANSIVLQDGSQIQSLLRDADPNNNLLGGRGRAGNVKIHANYSLTISGRDPSGQFPSAIFSSARSGTQGDSGDIDISTGLIVLDEDGSIVSSTFGPGRGGNIFIQADNLVLRSGGQVSGGSGRENVPGNFGRGGNVIVKVDDSIEIDADKGMINRSGIFTETSSPSYAGDLTVTTKRLTIKNGGAISSGASGSGSLGGDGGNLTVNASDYIELTGRRMRRNGSLGRASALTTEANGLGNAGKLTINAGRLSVRDGASISAIVVEGEFDGNGNFNPTVGNGGDIDIQVNTLDIANNGRIQTRTLGIGNAGNITINATGAVNLDGVGKADTGVFSNVELGAVGNGGNIFLNAIDLSLTRQAQISTKGEGRGNAGDITIQAKGDYRANDSQIAANAAQFGGGSISITARNIFLRENSDITTFSVGGNGGNIALTARAIVALEDSDILAFAPSGKGGNISFNTRAFLSAPLYRTTPPTTDLATLRALDGNGLVDVNASGTVSGTVSGVPDITFLQNSLTQLPTSLTDTAQLLANSCIVRRGQPNGSFKITGSGGLPQRPGDAPVSPFPTGDVRSVSEERGERTEERVQGADENTLTQNSQPITQNSPDRPWKIGDPIVEPQGVYKLANGELAMSRECSNP